MKTYKPKYDVEDDGTELSSLFLKYGVKYYVEDGEYGTDYPVFGAYTHQLDEIKRILEENNIECVAIPYETNTVIFFTEIPYLLESKGGNNYGSACIIESNGFKYVVVLAEND